MSNYRYGRQGLDVTWYLIILNGIVFFFGYLIELINPFFYNVEFLPLLALSPAVFFSRPWTIFTYMFLHANIWHILVNMVTLYFFGQFLSAVIGEKKFLIVYFIGGIVGGLFYILFAYTLLSGLMASVAVGASGAIFAVDGALVVLRPNERVVMFPLPIPMPLWLAIVISFLLILPGTAWQAHLGGVLAGLALGYIFKRQRRYY